MKAAEPRSAISNRISCRKTKDDPLEGLSFHNSKSHIRHSQRVLNTHAASAVFTYGESALRLAVQSISKLLAKCNITKSNKVDHITHKNEREKSHKNADS
jgi:hypothetical protein